MMEGKRILLVLGASSDLGCELISQVALNYDVVLAHYHRMNEKLEKLIGFHEGRVTGIQADFSDMAGAEQLVKELADRDLMPDHVVDLAALPLEYTRFEKVFMEQCEAGMQTSVYSFARIIQSILPYMKKKRKGKIVAVLSSCTNGIPPQFMSAYVTVKYALLGLIRSLSADYSDKGIQINGVSPEMIETKFLANIPDYVREKNAEVSPLKRNLCVGDVIPTIIFLLSDGSDCITGQNIFVTGGK